jgi:hypothetical protein
MILSVPSVRLRRALAAIEAKDDRGGPKDSAYFFALDRILLVA